MGATPEDPTPRAVWIGMAIVVAMMIGFAWGFKHLGPYFNR
jgi:hypothetical protein